MTTTISQRRARNHGIVPLAVAPALAGKVVAVAGVGGAGGSFVKPFLRQCGVREIRIADFDEYDVTNVNRQDDAFTDTLGLPKVSVVADRLRNIDPEVTVKVFPRGVELEQIDAFLAGADILVDAVDFKAPEIHRALVKRARQLRIPVIIGIEIAYGARAVWFSPDGMEFEKFFDLHTGDAQLSLERMIMKLPAYLDLGTFAAVKAGTLEAPAIATGGANLAALVVPMAEAILSGIDVPPPAPVGYYADTKAGRPTAGRIRYRRLAWWSSLVRVLVRYKLGRNRAAV